MYVCVLRWGRSLAWLARMLGRLCCTVIHKCIDVFFNERFLLWCRNSGVNLFPIES